MTANMRSERPDPHPESFLAWEERQRLLAFKAEGLAKDPPEDRPMITRYVWSPGALIDITCRGCGSSGCNRCAGREAIVRDGLGRDDRDPHSRAGRLLSVALSRLAAALGLHRGRSGGRS